MTPGGQGAVVASMPGGISLARAGAWLTLATVLAAFTGAAFWSVSLGPIHLFAYRVLMVGLWGYVLVTALYVRAPVVPAHLRAVRGVLAVLAAWFAYSVVNVAFVRDTGDYVTHAGFIAMGASLVFFAGYYLAHADWLERVYKLWIAVLVALVVMGLLQHVLGFQLAISQFAGAGDERRFTPMGTFSRVNQYAAFLALSAALPLSLITMRPGRWVTAAAVVLVVAVFYLLVVLGARAGLIALAVELAVAWMLLSGRCAGTRGGRLSKAALAVVAAVVVLGVALAALGGLAVIVEQLQSGQGSLGVRYNLVRNGLAFLRDSAGLGVGAGNFNAWIEATAYYPTEYGYGRETKEITYPHNWWIELLAEYGVVMTAAFVGLFVALVRGVIRVYRRAATPRQRRLGHALLIAFAGYVVVALGPGHFAAFRPQWVLLALAVAYVVSEGSESARPSTTAA